MKSSKLILALWLGATAWAQTLPQKQPVSPPVAAKPSLAPKPGVAPGVANAASSKNAAVPSGQAPGKPLPSPAKPAAAVRPARKPSARSVAQSSVGKPRWKRRASAGTEVASGAKPKHGKARRDPFVSPVVERVHEVATCSGTGRQCLLVGEVGLRGVVHSPSGFIAVVVNGEHTYFLRENDPLADGAVERITSDAIVLRERSSDAVGRPVTREVTKKLGVMPAVF